VALTDGARALDIIEVSRSHQSYIGQWEEKPGGTRRRVCTHIHSKSRPADAHFWKFASLPPSGGEQARAGAAGPEASLRLLAV